MHAPFELDAAAQSFATGLLPRLIALTRDLPDGSLVAVTASDGSIGAPLEIWCRFTGNVVVDASVAPGRARWVIRCGRVPDGLAADLAGSRAIGSRLWLYSNFDCNLQCDYCCVRSSPRVPRQQLGLARVRRIAEEASALGVRELFVTGGEPFLLPDVVDVLAACATAAPTTVLTNGLLLGGARGARLGALSRERITLQISLDSATPELHDLHRGRGTWARAREGIQQARSMGFRVRLAASVSTDDEAEAFQRLLDAEHIPRQDAVVRRIALRGVATVGVPIGRADLIPEVTLASDGVYFHPVGARDADLLVSRDVFPLADAIAAVRRAFEREREHAGRLARIFNCA